MRKIFIFSFLLMTIFVFASETSSPLNSEGDICRACSSNGQVCPPKKREECPPKKECKPCPPKKREEPKPCPPKKREECPPKKEECKPCPPRREECNTCP